MSVEQILRTAPVIPVIVLEREQDAVPLAEALVAGGLRVLEVTLRTSAAIAAIRAMAKVDGAIVGAGTVLNAAQYQAAVDAGSQFIVSPGLTPALASAAAQQRVPLLPGVATATELMLAREMGFTCMKFFPAEQAGGVPMVKAFGSVFKDMLFCPTGGITAATAPRYLALSNVACVGGSWLAPQDLLSRGAWKDIEQLAREAAQLRAPVSAG